jgi:hypothetical protein
MLIKYVSIRSNRRIVLLKKQFSILQSSYDITQLIKPLDPSMTTSLTSNQLNTMTIDSEFQPAIPKQKPPVQEVPFIRRGKLNVCKSCSCNFFKLFYWSKDVPPVIEVSIKPQRLQNHDVGDFINNKLREIDYDPSLPPYDSIQEYRYEGEGSNIASSLSSINTLAKTEQNDETDLKISKSDEDELDLEYLNELGPKFTNLYDIYSGNTVKNKTEHTT